MSSRIENVSYGEASINAVLSASGVYSCITVMIILSDSRTYMFHADPSVFNLEDTKNMQQEVEKVIKKSIEMFDQDENIFILGGLDNRDYKSFNKELNRMKDNYSTITPTIDGLNIEQLQEFLKHIDYSNTEMNIDGGDLDEKQGSMFISDLTIISDRAVAPPVFFMAQYYDYEIKLCGGYRDFKPQILFIFDFNNKSWNLIDIQLSTIQSAHVDTISYQVMIENRQKID